MLGNIYYTLDKYSHCWNTSNNMSSLYLCLPKNNVVPVLMSPYNVIFPKPMSFLYWYPPYTNTLCTLKYWYSPYINVPCTTELLGLKTLGLWRLGMLVPLDEFTDHQYPLHYVYFCPLTTLHFYPLTSVLYYPLNNVHGCPLTTAHYLSLTSNHYYTTYLPYCA